MKKLFLATSFLALSVSAAHADEPALQLSLGGRISVYGIYNDQDEAAGELRPFDSRKDTEVHLNGEVALDNGITAGAHFELNMDRGDTDNEVEESYLYLSSSWGRINIGEDNGAAYLLQVSAPSADGNIDGVKPEIGAFTAANGGTRNYAQDESSYTNKVTYLTPSFSGLQAGISFVPSLVQTATAGNMLISSGADLAGVEPSVGESDAGDHGNLWEGALRYERSFDAINLALGTGYTFAELEAANPPFLSDDLHTWNVAGNIDWGAFGFGAVYLSTNNGLENADTDIWVAGIDYTTGAYKFGASYYNSQTEEGMALAGTDDQEIERWTAGVVYEWGPGMSFRGAVQHQSADNIGAVAGADGDGTMVSLGTQIEF